jgi:asparagine synthase (glutamine-hydrolysing)
MCGINAAFAYGGDAPPVTRAEIVRVRDAMAARGPDGAGLWLDPERRIGLGHRRLAIIDPGPAGSQPMATADGNLVITYNGEIYNYRSLREELCAAGVAPRTHSDTEVLLLLYQRLGPAMLNRLRGMYAFAIWDARRQGLFMARDPFGIKPLYVADDGRTLRMASQVKALFAGEGMDGAPDPAGHVGFFVFGSVPEPHTLYSGIRALPAGSSLWVERGGARRTSHFAQIPGILAAARPLPAPASDDESAAAIRDSVQSHLVADVPVGVFLSAGIDSTAVAALAAQTQPGPLRTITLGFAEYRGLDQDETPIAEHMARLLGAQHRTVWVTNGDFASQSACLLQAMDQPSIDGVNVYFVAKAAAESGLKVALSGLGGDELFGGYAGMYRDIPRLVSRVGLVARLPALGRVLRAAAAPAVRRFTSPKYAGLIEYGGSITDAYLLRRALYMPWELLEFLPPELVAAGWEELAARQRLAETASGLTADRQRLTALDMCWYMRNQLLRDADWAGMAHSVEIRVPLVDVELLRRLAPGLTGAEPLTKTLLANAPQPPLPPLVAQRPKTGFCVPVREWLAQSAAGGLDLELTRARGLRGWARLVYEAFCGISEGHPRPHRLSR